MIVGFAGPAANLAQAALGSAVAWALYPMAPQLVQTSEPFAYFYLMFLPLYVLVNLYLMMFNILPVPPLDGSSIYAVLIPERHLHVYYEIERYAMPAHLAARGTLRESHRPDFHLYGCHRREPGQPHVPDKNLVIV